MSAQAVRDFWRAAEQDPGLQAKVQAIPGHDREALVAGFVRVAAEAGFAFTAEEYEAAFEEELARRRAARELALTQFKPVGGGDASS